MNDVLGVSFSLFEAPVTKFVEHYWFSLSVKLTFEVGTRDTFPC